MSGHDPSRLGQAAPRLAHLRDRNGTLGQGIPLGCAVGTSVLATGDRVLVDGDHGLVFAADHAAG